MVGALKDNSRQHQNGHVDASNGDVPPSTRAAQLAEHLVDGQQRTRNQDQQSFQQLLREVLESASEHAHNDQTFDRSAEVNGKLIFVIVRVGIDSVTQSSPFNPKSQQEDQLLDSLKAIRISLQRSPAVLFSPSPDSRLEDGNKICLYEWLFQRVLAVATTINHTKVQTQIALLLKTALLCEHGLSEQPSGVAGISTYLRCMTQGEPCGIYETID